MCPEAIRMQRRRRGESESKRNEGVFGRVFIMSSNLKAKLPSCDRPGKRNESRFLT